MRRWEDNIRMSLKEIGWEAVDMIHLTQEKDKWWDLVNNGNEPSVYIKGGELLD
jgi:hypothetical protein